MRRAGLALFLIASCGCARNAILEVDVELPAARGEANFARVELNVDELGETPFDVEWGAPPLEPVALGAGPSLLDASVVAEGYAGDVLARVRFCKSPTCDDLTTPRDPQAEVRFRVERPLYVGNRTGVALRIPEVPATPSMPPRDCEMVPAGQPTWACVIERCDVRGCQSGDGLSFCVGDLHACEL